MERAVIRDDRIDEDSEKVAEILKKPKEEIKVVLETVLNTHKNSKRQPKEPAPEGGIHLRAAERKYGIGNRTLSEWVKNGYLPLLSRTKNELYVEEDKLAQIIQSYNSLPASSRRTIRKAIAAL